MLVSKKSLISLVLLLFLVSCAGARSSSRNNFNSGPKWIHTSAGAYTINGVRVLRSVGSSLDSSFGLDDDSLRMTQAKDNASANLSYYMKTYVKALRTSYKRSQSKNGELKNFERTAKHLSEVLTKYSFSGLKVVKKWQSPKDKTLYVMMELRLDYVDEVVTSTIENENKKQGLTTNLDDVRRRSAEAHKRLDEATDDLEY